MTTPSTKDKEAPRREGNDRRESHSGPSLAINDPDAGYTTPDLSYHDGTGELPPEEKEWHDRRNSLHDERVEAVEEGEKKVFEQRAKDEEEASKPRSTKTGSTAKATPAATES